MHNKMFNLRYFPLNVLNFKHISNGKLNVIKQLNYENKSLYGGLLETQKQRRKLIKKVVQHSQNSFGSSTVKECNIEHKRSSKRKTTETSSETLPPLHNESNYIDADPLISESKASDKTPVQSKLDNNCTQINNDFIFKSALLINETNYPMENSNKSSSPSSDNVLNFSFTDAEVKQYAKFPSVSKIMEDTMSDKNKLILSKWRQNMIKDLGQEAFNKHCEDLKTRGHEFHSAVCDKVLGNPKHDYSEVTQNALRSLDWMMEHVSSPLAVESITAHPHLAYKGIPDCVLHFRGVPVLVDWKLSEKPKKHLKDTYEAPIQIVAYIGALNHDPNYKWGLNHGLVVVAYTNGDPCDVFLLAPKHCQIYWRHWLTRCDRFKTRSHLHLDHDIDETSLS